MGNLCLVQADLCKSSAARHRPPNSSNSTHLDTELRQPQSSQVRPPKISTSNTSAGPIMRVLDRVFAVRGAKVVATVRL
jgi:hypothetical protein